MRSTPLMKTLRSLALVAGLAACAVAQAGGMTDLLSRAAEAGVKKLAERNASKTATNDAGLQRDSGNFASCANLFPRQSVVSTNTVSADWKPKALCFSNFAVLHSGLSKTPLLVIERISSAQIADAAGEQRTDEFFADHRLAMRDRAELSDYQGTGFDRGHMAPAANMPDQAAMAQSFALSNMVPQDPTNNRKIWSKVESDVRKFARRAQGNVYVFSGPLFQDQERTQTIGKNRVWVPTHLFKMVYDEASGRSWAYVLPNSANARIEAPMDYASFVQATGWNVLSN